MKNIASVIITFLFLQIGSSYAQSLKFTDIKNLWLSEERDLDFAGYKFLKDGEVYERDRVTICSNGDSVLTNYNEKFNFFYSGSKSMLYVTYSQSIFIELSQEIRKFEKIGSMDKVGRREQRGSVYYDGRYYYVLYILNETCHLDKASPLNSYEIWFYKEKPSLVKTD